MIIIINNAKSPFKYCNFLLFWQIYSWFLKSMWTHSKIYFCTCEQNMQIYSCMEICTLWCKSSLRRMQHEVINSICVCTVNILCRYYVLSSICDSLKNWCPGVAITTGGSIPMYPREERRTDSRSKYEKNRNVDPYEMLVSCILLATRCTSLFRPY